MANPWHTKLKACAAEYQAAKAANDPKVIRRKKADSTRNARRAAARERTNPTPAPAPAPVTPERSAPTPRRRIVATPVNSGGAPSNLAPRRIIATPVNTAPNTHAPRVVTQSLNAGHSNMDVDEDGGELIFKRGQGKGKIKGNQTLKDLAKSTAYNRLSPAKKKAPKFLGKDTEEKAIEKSDNLSKAQQQKLADKAQRRRDKRKSQAVTYNDMEARARALDAKHTGLAF
jgi:hypothetical protein